MQVHRIPIFAIAVVCVFFSFVTDTLAFVVIFDPNDTLAILGNHRRQCLGTVGSPLRGSDRDHPIAILEAHHVKNDDGVQIMAEEFEENNGMFAERRHAIFRTALTAVLTVFTTPSPSFALKERNEALCGTGFFEHIYEYKCTAIGDIQDEGMSKGMSQAQSESTDSLMGKFGFDTMDIVDTTTYGETKKSKQSGKSNDGKESGRK